MQVNTTQIAVDHGGKRYAALYSVAANTMILRVPGIGSRSKEMADGDDHKVVAKALLEDILAEAERAGTLT